MTANKNADGAQGFNEATVMACQNKCLGDTACVAFDFDPNTSGPKCWIHTNAEQAKQLKDAQGVNHYARKPCEKGECQRFEGSCRHS